MNQDISVDALHFTYKQPLAAQKAQESFTKYYPGSKILCVVDLGGTYPSSNYDSEKIKLIYSSQKISLEKQGIYISENEIKNYLNFLIESTKLNDKSKWIFILEDDVKIIRAVEELNYGLNGSTAGRFNRKIRKLLLIDTKFKYLKGRYGGCGGSFLRKSIILNYDIDTWMIKLQKYFKSSGGILATDQVISIMTVLANENIGPYRGFMETHYSEFQEALMSNSITTLHSYKEYYE